MGLSKSINFAPVQVHQHLIGSQEMKKKIDIKNLWEKIL